MKAEVLKRLTLQKLSNCYRLINEASEFDFVEAEEYCKILDTLYRMNIRSYNKGFFTKKISQEEQEKKYKIDHTSKARFRDENYCCILKNFEYLSENITVRPRGQEEHFAVDTLDDIIYTLKDFIINNLEDYITTIVD